LTLGITTTRRAKSRWLALGVIVVMASALAAAGSITLAASSGEAANINQCRDGSPTAHVQCIGSAFQNGNLGATNSHYREGDSVPFQTILTGITAGTHTLIINWAETASSKHAYDYIDTYTASETNADACAGVLTANTSTACPAPQTATITPDPSLASGVCPGFVGTQKSGVIDLWPKASIDSASFAYTSGPAPSPVLNSCQGTANTQFATITFHTTSAVPTIVMAWGGHVASQIDWGLGNSASAISGSPYHMALGNLDGASTGSQDRSIKAAAILPVPTIVTQVSSATTAVGTSITDLATLTGANGTVTGTVQFYYCGPFTVATACTFGAAGTHSLGAAATLGASPPTPAVPGEAASTSFPGTTGVSPSAGDIYCFALLYTPDATAPYSPGESNSTTNECVSFTSIGTGTVTSPTSGSIVLGDSNTDTATVTGNANGGSPTGTVDFWLCSPAQMTALSETTCASGGTADTGNHVALTAGSNNTATASSTAVTPDAVGTWCYRAVYNPATGSSYTTSNDALARECFSVTPATTTTVTTPPSGTVTVGATNVTDSALVTGNATGGSPTGFVKFFLCSPTDLTNNSETVCTTGGTADTANANLPIGGVALTTGANHTSSATSDAFTVNVAGTWCFRGEYSGNSNYQASSDATSDECFTVGPASPSNTTAQSLIPDDSFTLSNGFSPTGTIDFYLFAPGVNPTCATTSTAEALAAFHQQVTVSGNGTYPTTNHLSVSPQPYVATAVGTYHWLAIYTSGDANNNNSSSLCTETFNITN
jgi:hypothetical protein